MTTLPASCPRCGFHLDATPAPPPPVYAAPVATELPRYPQPQPQPAPRRTGPITRLGAASVPKILLGLGATCLLVAAVIFLAVAWSWLGIGGRTAVLVALTAATGAAGQWLLRRDLRVAAEALTTVALGLLTLDLVGARNFGWLEIGPDGFLGVVGGALLLTSLALCAADRRLVVPQVLAPLAWPLTVVGLGSYVDAVEPVATVAVVGFAAIALLAGRLRLELMAMGAAIFGAIAWVVLLALTVGAAVEHPSLRGLWLDGHGPWLLVTAVVALLGWGVSRQAACATAAVVLTLTAALPALDEGLTSFTLAAAAATVVWAVAAGAAPPRWSLVPRVPLVVAALALLPVPLTLAAQAAAALGSVAQPFTAEALVRLDPSAAVAPPVLLPLAAAVLVAAAGLALPRTAVLRMTHLGLAGAAVLALAGTGAAALHPLPLAAFVAAPVVLAVLLLVAERPRPAAALALVSLLLALPSAVLVLVVLAIVVAGCVSALVRGSAQAAPYAGGVLAVASAALVWTVGHLLDAAPDHRSLAVVATVGLLALALPRTEVEAAGWGVALLAAMVGVPPATDVSVSLAVHLTLAGALVTATALLHRDHRWAAWPGGLLLAAATWVRLADLGVQAPEAYTLPSAAALVLVGLDRLRRDPGADTMLALAPALTLATVPSLLWALVDPISPRAVVLGFACLALVLSGSALRWTAPVLVGAAVGGLLVLRELAPYAAQTPQWVLIGTAGTLLIGVGVTWEARLRDLQHAAGYLGRLR